jgi:hypothetical protein
VAVMAFDPSYTCEILRTSQDVSLDPTLLNSRYTCPFRKVHPPSKLLEGLNFNLRGTGRADGKGGADRGEAALQGVMRSRAHPSG